MIVWTRKGQGRVISDGKTMLHFAHSIRSVMFVARFEAMFMITFANFATHTHTQQL